MKTNSEGGEAMSEYYVDRFIPAYGDDALAVMDGVGKVVGLFTWDQRQEAEALAEALNSAWRDGHANGVASMASTRLAPEHADALRRKAAHGGTPSYLRDAILAALAALGEPAP